MRDMDVRLSVYSRTHANTFGLCWRVKALRDKDSRVEKCIRGREGSLVRMVTLRLTPEDVEVLDGLAGLYGSRAQAVRFLLREAGTAYLALRREIVGLREEVAALRAVVERFGRAEVVTRREEERRPGDEEAVKQVLGALLSMKRTAKID